MPNPNPSPETRFQAGVSGNPGGVPKEAVQVRVITQRMWGLFYADDPQYAEMAAKYPKIAASIEARYRQANEDANTAAITRVDSENMGPLVTKVDLKSAISEMDDERLLALRAFTCAA